PGDEPDRGREDAEVDDPGEARAGGVRELALEARDRPRAADRRDYAGEEDRLEAGHAPQDDLLRDHAARVAERGEQAEPDAEATRVTAVRGRGRDQDDAGERDPAAREERAGI